MPPRSAFDQFRRDSEARMQAAALNATATAARNAKGVIRREMAAAKLGRMGNAIDDGSDAEKTGRMKLSGSGWRASGWVFIRSRSPRTRGAIEAYTEGAEIAPRNGRYLWIATDQIPVRAGRAKMTPGNWSKAGLDTRIGPLVPIKSASGTPLLIVKKVGVSASGKSRSARSLTKKGLARKGQIGVDYIVAFYGIPRTSRQARVDVDQIVAEAQASLPSLIARELKGR